MMRSRKLGRAHPATLAQLNDDRPLRNARRAGVQIGGILLDPIPCDLQALVRPRLVLADRHRNAPIAGADERIGHDSRDRTKQTFDFALVLLQQVEQLFRPGAGIISYDRVHETLPG